MTKELKVIKPVLNLSAGDIFKISNDGNYYIYAFSQNTGNAGSMFSMNTTINTDFAENLVKNGYLEEVEQKNSTKDFKNIFTEIDILLDKYNKQLDNLDEEFKDSPACLKVEKCTVLKNIISTLEHLKNLKR